MEALKEPPLENAILGVVKTNVMTCEDNAGAEITVQSDVCHKPNGVADSGAEQVHSVDATGIPVEEQPNNTIIEEVNNSETVIVQNEPDTTEVIIETPTPTPTSEKVTKAEPEDQNAEKTDLNPEIDMHTEDVEVDGIVEVMPENVRFETEILIETNVEDQSTKFKIIYDDDSEQSDHTNNILNEIGQNLELSEVLRSSDVTQNVENNNCDVAQEVFNKEELLDILEGNDMEESKKVISDKFSSDCSELETQLALQQLSRLKQTKRTRRSRSTPKKKDEDFLLTPKKKIGKKDLREAETDISQTDSATTEHKTESIKKKGKQKDDYSQSDGTPENKEEITKKKGSKQKDDNSKLKPNNSNQKDENGKTNSVTKTEPKEHNIVNDLVQDWEDEEPSEGDQAKTMKADSDELADSGEVIKSQEAAVNISNEDAPTGDSQTPNQVMNDSAGQPQRRQSRVIKKKVIFDPDNPDTFTKSKVAIKKDNQSEKDQTEQPVPKKVKTDLTRRSQSKSPVQSKLQWKKPQPKNFKQNKRLTEIDRLLMDEGAVNMICQLTPEAPQGNKNTKSKAEFIKKIQSSTTPEGKEMKFRERKKEFKIEEDVKRIGSAKDRLLVGSSVKSPSRSEDFEAHSADDSIIYRRHSSSSYSSPCMSPRRMSDVESINQNANATPLEPASDGSQIQQDGTVATPTGTNVFMADSPSTPTTTVINKSNLMSIKEKLNSKLSQALNKRKRENLKPEKPPKMKKVSKSSEKLLVIKDFKYVKLFTDERLAEICIQQIGNIFNVEVINELRTVLDTVDNKNDISVTLLTSESGKLCSGLELNSILDQEKGANNALELAESARALLSTLESHSKLLCAAVGDRCHGLALSLVALSDITVASENAVFGLSATKGTLLQSGVAALTSCGLPQSLLNELIVFERPISAAEALQGGLASRTVWPHRVLEQARTIARDIASQPHENIMLKKQLLRLKRGVSESFLAGLQLERDLLVNYWTSTEGRELVRACVEAAKE